MTRVESTLALILQEILHMSQQLDTLKAKVANMATVEQSVLTLLQGLAAKVAALQPDEDAIAQLAMDIQADTDAMTAAVKANTPAAPVAPVPPAPAPTPAPEPTPAPVEPTQPQGEPQA